MKLYYYELEFLFMSRKCFRSGFLQENGYMITELTPYNTDDIYQSIVQFEEKWLPRDKNDFISYTLVELE